MTRRQQILVAVSSALVAVVAGAILSVSNRVIGPSEEAGRAESHPAGVRAVLDPDTGLPSSDPEVVRRVLESSAPPPPLSTQEALRFSHQGLFEETLPNGLVVVDLQGRFAAPLAVKLPAQDRADDPQGTDGASE